MGNSQAPKPKPDAIFVVGGPGSGKGTQCKLMKQRYNYSHLSTGSLLRQFVKKGGEQAEHIQQMMHDGILIPSPVLVEIIQQKVFGTFPEKKVFILDGFPRNQQNWDVWQKIIKEDINIRMMLYIECDIPILRNRLLERAKTSGRIDDNPETIQKRFKTFETHTVPFTEKFKKEHHKFVSVDGMQSIEKVAQSIQAVLKAEGLL